MKLSGVYAITCTITGDRYVGSAINLKHRARQHWRALVLGMHSNERLQRAVDKYGIRAFTFEVLELCEPALCVTYEQAHIDMLQPEYNLAPVAGSNLGVKRSEEAKAKMSAAAMGNTHAMGHEVSEEARAKISAAKKHIPDATRAKISAAAKRRASTPEGKAHLSRMGRWSPKGVA